MFKVKKDGGEFTKAKSYVHEEVDEDSSQDTAEEDLSSIERDSSGEQNFGADGLSSKEVTMSSLKYWLKALRS